MRVVRAQPVVGLLVLPAPPPAQNEGEVGRGWWRGWVSLEQRFSHFPLSGPFPLLKFFEDPREPFFTWILPIHVYSSASSKSGEILKHSLRRLETHTCKPAARQRGALLWKSALGCTRPQPLQAPPPPPPSGESAPATSGRVLQTRGLTEIAPG